MSNAKFVSLRGGRVGIPTLGQTSKRDDRSTDQIRVETQKSASLSSLSLFLSLCQEIKVSKSSGDAPFDQEGEGRQCPIGRKGQDSCHRSKGATDPFFEIH